MNIEEKKQIANLIMLRAELSGRTFSSQAIGMMIDDLSDLHAQAIIDLLKRWGQIENQFPSPAIIRSKLKPEIDEKDDVQESVNRIITAVPKYGYTNPSGAKNFIGELGWQIVTGSGGWQSLCENLTDDNIGIYRAQLRDYGISVWKRAKRGELNEAPSLPMSIKNMLPNLKGIE